MSPDRFQSGDRPVARALGALPQAWPDSPERSLLAGEALDLVRASSTGCRSSSASSSSLRDVDGYDSDEVCALLDLTAANQRVLLHRGRARIRAALADYFEAVS